LNDLLKMFVDELPLNGKVSVFVVTAPNAVGAVSRRAPATAASATATRLFTTRPPVLDGGEPVVAVVTIPASRRRVNRIFEGSGDEIFAVAKRPQPDG
jgi:hypothetical protein